MRCPTIMPESPYGDSGIIVLGFLRIADDTFGLFALSVTRILEIL